MASAFLLRGSKKITRRSHFAGWAAALTGTPIFGHGDAIGNPVSAAAVAGPSGGSSTRAFHRSTTVLETVRRRRRGGSMPVEETSPSDASGDNIGGSNGDGRHRGLALQHPPVQDALKFRQAAGELFDKLERALEPMKDKNDFFVVERLDGEIGEILRLDLGPKEGFYELEISEDECIFQYSSPISGHILYCLSSVSGEWVGCDDGHLFEGIFVRDLIRQCQGLPNL
jgi:hypothetical protein